MTLFNRLSSLAVCMLLALAAHGQVNTDAIGKSVVADQHAYRALLNRFTTGDTSLTPAQQQMVYYGFPYSSEAPAHEANHSRLDAAYSAARYPEALSLAEDALRLNPVSLDLTIKAMVSASQCSDAQARAKLPALQARYDMLVNTILTSGRGTELHSPFLVNSKSDQFRILRNVLQVSKIVGYSTIAGCSAAKFLLPDDPQEKILYFKILH